jgi:hypothetical protein
VIAGLDHVVIASPRSSLVCWPSGERRNGRSLEVGPHPGPQLVEATGGDELH